MFIFLKGIVIQTQLFGNQGVGIRSWSSHNLSLNIEVDIWVVLFVLVKVYPQSEICDFVVKIVLANLVAHYIVWLKIPVDNIVEV